MVTRRLAAKWSPLGVAQRLRNLIERPSDFGLMLRIGLFLRTAPRDLEHAALPELLDRLRLAPRPAAGDLHRAVGRIARLRQPWLRLMGVSEDDNTCYLRALCLYRFLDPGDRQLQIHFGVERDQRLRGHAWVTVDAEIIEPPEPVCAGRVTEIYRHPPT